MNEEKKYSIIGTVKIGTDEYRDLISGLAKAEADADSYRAGIGQNKARHLI